ncbi:MAG TPA: hypothetical protein VK204_15375 [Nocardioidaceae bacterium]|nr:hypothetical protein [Nocardioidaceae bacterium]
MRSKAGARAHQREPARVAAPSSSTTASSAAPVAAAVASPGGSRPPVSGPGSEARDGQRAGFTQLLGVLDPKRKAELVQRRLVPSVRRPKP